MHLLGRQVVDEASACPCIAPRACLQVCHVYNKFGVNSTQADTRRDSVFSVKGLHNNVNQP